MHMALDLNKNINNKPCATNRNTCATNQEENNKSFLKKTFLIRKNVCAARFARRAVIFLVLFITYLNGGNIHGPLCHTPDMVLLGLRLSAETCDNL